MFHKIYNLYFKNSLCFLTIQRFHTYDLRRLGEAKRNIEPKIISNSRYYKIKKEKEF